VTPKQQARATTIALDEALQRMQAGRPLHLPPGFRWTKKNLAKEAGLHITTLLKRDPDKAFVYAEANATMEQGPDGAPRKMGAQQRLRRRIAELEAKVLHLQRHIATMAQAGAAK
jgi:hypothetical protein